MQGQTERRQAQVRQRSPIVRKAVTPNKPVNMSIAECAAFSAYHSPTGSFLGGFRTPATGQCRTAFLTGIQLQTD
jgi:hypothetical protein